MKALLPCCYDCPHQLKERSNFWYYSYSNTKTGIAPDARFCLEMWWKNWKALIWENPGFKTCLCHLLCMYLFWSRPFLDVKDRHPVKLAQVKSGFYCRIHEAISQACHQNQKLFSLILHFGFPITQPNVATSCGSTSNSLQFLRAPLPGGGLDLAWLTLASYQFKQSS